MCLVLFTVANVLKTLLTKIVASNFHRRAHFQKMEDALNKVQNILKLAVWSCHMRSA